MGTYESLDVKGKICPLLKETCIQDKCALCITETTLTEDGFEANYECLFVNLYMSFCMAFIDGCESDD